jgi:branched-chain amino acid transport system ATP-binding protein
MLTSLVPGMWRQQEQEIEQRADELLVRFRMDHMRDEMAGTLSGGQRKLLEMARALMVDPSMVMLDEPMAGVNPALTQSLLGHVKNLPSFGKTVLFVEHDMDVVMDISDWVVVMAQGRIIAEGPPQAVSKDPAVIDAYLGQEHGDETRFTPVPRAGAPAADAAAPAIEVAPPDESEGTEELRNGATHPEEQP